jgi:Tol biopolymer transport system component
LLAFSILGGSPAFAGEVRYIGDGHAYHPVWSRDGKYLAFEVNRLAGDTDLFVSEVTGAIAKDAVKVTLPGGTSAYGGGSQVVVNPTWATQNVAVFEGSNQGGQFRLYAYQPGGGAATEMIPTSQIPGDLTFPYVSADGKQMTFIADASGAGDIRVRDTATGAITQLTATSAPEVFPTYSADSAKIAFSRKTNNTEDLFELTLASKAEATLAGGGGDQVRSVYAAGKMVFFDDSRGDNLWDIAVVDAAGSPKRLVAKGVRLPLRARPAVSPDGKWVAFAYDDPTKSGKIMLVTLDGGTTVEISTTFTACGEPALTVQNGRTLLAFTALPSSTADWRFLYVEDITDKLQ